MLFTKCYHQSVNKILSICLLHLFCFFYIACEKDDFFVDGIQDDLLIAVFEEPHVVSSNEVLERAYKMATMAWTPLRPVPMRGGYQYESNITVFGAPYSQVGQFNTSLFQDVSYHTFITAVHNPKSVLYSEDLSQPPYNGVNCATYYGSVCSSSVMWALGFRIPYSTYHLADIPYINKLERQELDSLKVCDILWKTGHVQMVFDIEHKADTLYRVKLFEQSGSHAHIKTYTKAGLRRMWEEYGYVAYRYEYLSYSDESIVYQGFEQVEYNDDLCPSKGDRAVYRNDDTITIDIFNHNYKEIVLQKDGVFVSTNKVNGDLFQYHGLYPGVYEAFLRTGELCSSPVYFEIIQTDVKISTKRGKEIKVSFKSSAYADYVVLFRQVGPPLYYLISDYERKKGIISIPIWDVPEYYCKVVFRGEYGTMINRPIRVR